MHVHGRTHANTLANAHANTHNLTRIMLSVMSREVIAFYPTKAFRKDGRRGEATNAGVETGVRRERQRDSGKEGSTIGGTAGRRGVQTVRRRDGGADG